MQPLIPGGTERRRVRCLSLALVLIVVGVTWRMAPLHLPSFLYKYGGSMLWAAMVYCLVAAALPRLAPPRAGALAAVAAFLVEFSRLYHAPAFDAFRLTLAGKLLLGRIFSVRDLLAYALAIAVAAGVDFWWERTGRRQPQNQL